MSKQILLNKYIMNTAIDALEIIESMKIFRINDPTFEPLFLTQMVLTATKTRDECQAIFNVIKPGFEIGKVLRTVKTELSDIIMTKDNSVLRLVTEIHEFVTACKTLISYYKLYAPASEVLIKFENLELVCAIAEHLPKF